MRVFLTGATGFVGSAIVCDLLAAGHEVVGLVRSEQGALSLREAGAEVVRGSLEDLDSLRTGAEASDGVIHTAFNNSDLTKFAESSEIERRAIEALGEALAGSDRPLLVTAGLASLVPGRIATENDVARPGASPRVAERTALEQAERGVRVSVIRLPCVHGRGDRYTIPTLIDLARRHGASAYVGDGLNRWSAVHSIDTARLYRLVLERGQQGQRYHAVAEEAVPLREIAQAIGRSQKIRVISVTAEQAAEHFGAFAGFAQADIPASSAQTRRILGWHPQGPGLLDDIETPGYYGA